MTYVFFGPFTRWRVSAIRQMFNGHARPSPDVDPTSALLRRDALFISLLYK